MIDRILRYNNFILNEMSINDNSLKRYKNVLQNLSDYKSTSNFINDLIIRLKNNISDDGVEIEKYDEDDIYKLYRIIYNPKAKSIIDQLEYILFKSKDKNIYDTYFHLIYPDNNKFKFNVEIDIEKNKMNRIHVPVGLPYILKGIGIGKTVYKLLITELGYISSFYNDRTMESLYVWNSIRKDNEVYTFIKDENIISISPKLEFEKMVDLLDNFFKNLKDEIVILDNDFKDKYNKDILKSKKLYPILNYEINQTIKEREQYGRQES